MLYRRQFLQLWLAAVAAFAVDWRQPASAFIAPKLRAEPGINTLPKVATLSETDVSLEDNMPHGNQWVFPLTFPAWFPVEPTVPHGPASRIYLPMIKNG